MANKDATERRKGIRRKTDLDARLKVPLPEEGSATLVAKAMIENLSPAGARVFIRAIKKEHLPILLQTQRKCYVICQLPDRQMPVVLQGDITWLDVQGNTVPPTAHLGLDISKTEPNEREFLERFLENLESRKVD